MDAKPETHGLVVHGASNGAEEAGHHVAYDLGYNSSVYQRLERLLALSRAAEALALTLALRGVWNMMGIAQERRQIHHGERYVTVTNVS